MRRTALLAIGAALLAGCSKAPDRVPPAVTDALKGPDVPHKELPERAARKAVEFLLANQNADGGYGFFKGKPQSQVGVTALVAYSLMKSPLKLTEGSTPQLARAMEYVLSHQKPSGAISDPAIGLDNYTTSAGVMALVMSGNPAHRKAIEKAEAYLRGVQIDEGEGVTKDSPFWGGAPYKPGRPVSDGSNTGFLLDALHAAGADADDPAMQKALVFIRRLQNNPEVNDMPWAKAVAPEDFGGGVYRPAKSPDREDIDISKLEPRKLADGRVGWRSYGSMTYQIFKGFIYAGLGKDDPGVAAALGWIKNNYTLEENPGIGTDGQYYYYRVFARALSAWGQREVAGHDWARDLADKLVELQNADGSWVNPDPKVRWFEGDPALVTAYALEALSLAMDGIARSK